MVILINIIGFNIVWFGLVYFGNNFTPIALLYFSAHFVFFAKNNGEPKYLLLIALIGILTDSFLHYFNVFIFLPNEHIPLWLACLWLCFSTTLYHSLRFLGKSIWFQLLAGFVAPFSYFAGNQLGAVTFGNSSLITYIVLAITWSSLFVLFFSLKKHFQSIDINNQTALRGNPHV